MSITAREFLGAAVVPKEAIDRFLDGDADNWAYFDPELGYLLKDYVVRDGVDDCYTINQYVPRGQRRMVNYAERPCRINTFGDSFTQCHQVSDGETWQEYLAAHLGEPVRNFGIGGYGVFQAFRRMLREEQTGAAAEYVVLNMWSDDHLRSIYPCRWIQLPWFHEVIRSGREPFMFHANPWCHLRFNPDTGRFEEHESICPTPESLYRLSDADWVYETFKDSFDVQAYLASQGSSDADTAMLQRYADALDVHVDFSSADATAAAGKELLTTCSLRSSMYVAERARDFCQANGKKLMIHLSYDDVTVQRACRGEARFDRMLVDYLNENGFLFVDALRKHAEDFEQFKCTPEQYTRRYYIGHYKPAGNHFYAFAVKDAIAEWLDPKPPAYVAGGVSMKDWAATLA